MKRPGRHLTDAEREQLRKELRRDVAQRQLSYRAKALRMFAHVCARCGREFSGSRLKELTVHHRDHNHNNNPPDGSNWELLCIYCHDHEHEKHRVAGHGYGGQSDKVPRSTFSAFDNLDALLKPPESPPQDDSARGG